MVKFRRALTRKGSLHTVNTSSLVVRVVSLTQMNSSLSDSLAAAAGEPLAMFGLWDVGTALSCQRVRTVV